MWCNLFATYKSDGFSLRLLLFNNAKAQIFQHLVELCFEMIKVSAAQAE